MSKKCIHCGADLHDQASFCHVCETTQVEKQALAPPRVGWKRPMIMAGCILAAFLLLFLAGSVISAGNTADAPDTSKSNGAEPVDSQQLSESPVQSEEPVPSETVASSETPVSPNSPELSDDPEPDSSPGYFSYTDYPMDTLDELVETLELIAQISDPEQEVQVILPAVTYSGGLTLDQRSFLLQGSTDPQTGAKTTFTGTIVVSSDDPEPSVLKDLRLLGEGGGTGLIARTDLYCENCEIIGWSTGATAESAGWLIISESTFRENMVGVEFANEYRCDLQDTNIRNSVFEGNETAFLLSSTYTPMTFFFPGTAFIENEVHVMNRSQSSVDTSGAHFSDYTGGRERYSVRLLSDLQLAELKDADAETLQREISTVADAVAWLDQFEYEFYSALDRDFKLDIEYMLSRHRTDATGSDIYTAFTGWCLADDYPEAKYLIASGSAKGFTWIYHSLLLPVEDGYNIVNASSRSTRWNCVWGFDEKTVSGLDGIEEQLIPYHAGMSDDSGLFLYHLFAADVGQDNISFWLDGDYLITSSDATELYRN